MKPQNPSITETDGHDLPPVRVRRPRGSAPAARVGTAIDENAQFGGLEKYLAHLARLDMPLAMKIDLIRSLRAIMQSFVDRAFGDDPVQQALAAGGKSSGEDDPNALPVIDLEPTTENQTENLTDAFRNPAVGPGREK